MLSIGSSQRHNAIRVNEFIFVTLVKIHAFKPFPTAKIADDTQAIAKIIGDIQRIAVGADGKTRRINRSLIAIVRSRWRFSGKSIYVNEGRRDFSVWSRRTRRDRKPRTRSKSEMPYLVFKSAGNVKWI